MPSVLIDERRMGAGIDDALASLASAGPYELLTPARFLERVIGSRVLDERERRAVIRRVAGTRAVGLPAHVVRAPGFAARAAAAIDAGRPGVYEPLLGELRTLLGFADTLDTRSALAKALAAPRRDPGIERLGVDGALLEDEDTAFAWRRLTLELGIGFDPLTLAPPQPPVVDPRAVAGVIAVLRFAATESDADARAALVAPFSPVAPDDARALLAACGDRVDVLETIEGGRFSLGPEARDAAFAFAHALRSIAGAYRRPDATASATIAEILASFAPFDGGTATALEGIARAFDLARALAPVWDAQALIDEIAAETEDVVPPRAAVDIAPAEPREPEPQAPVAVRPRASSASSLGAYAECARKWYYRYVCAAVEDKGSSASFYGIAFHAALEDFHGRYARFDPAERNTLWAALDGAVSAAFDRHRTRFDAPVEFELQKRRARRTARRYLDWLLERAQRAPFVVAGCEVAAEVELDGESFVGFIDRLDRDERDGTVTVVDYKTGAIAKSAQEYLDDVLAGREFQLPFYYWARTAAGDRVARLQLVPLKEATLAVAPIELAIGTKSSGGERGGTSGTISVADLQRARERMVALARRLGSGTLAEFPVAEDPEACRYCAYLDACRDRPVALEERFGR